MSEPDTPEIDRRLREAFEDDAVAAGRVARTALAVDNAGDGRLDRGLAAAMAPHARHRWAAVAAGATVVLLASALVFWPTRPARESGEVSPEPPELAGVLSDGALVVQLPDGSTSISWGAARNDRPPDGSGIVIVEGAAK